MENTSNSSSEKISPIITPKVSIAKSEPTVVPKHNKKKYPECHFEEMNSSNRAQPPREEGGNR